MKKSLFIAGPPLLSIALLFLGLISDDSTSDWGLVFLFYGIPLVIGFCFFWVIAVGISMTQKRLPSNNSVGQKNMNANVAHKWDTPIDHFAIALIFYMIIWYLADNHVLGDTLARNFGFPLSVILAGITALAIGFFKKRDKGCQPI